MVVIDQKNGQKLSPKWSKEGFSQAFGQRQLPTAASATCTALNVSKVVALYICKQGNFQNREPAAERAPTAERATHKHKRQPHNPSGPSATTHRQRPPETSEENLRR